MVGLTIWLGIGVCVLFVVIVLAVIVLKNRNLRIKYYRWKYKENFLRIILICENNRAIEHFGFIKANLTVEYNNSETYVVDPVDVIYLNKIPTIFYNRGNPSPLDFRKSKEEVVTVNSENLKNVMNQKIIKDLSSENNMLLYILIACIASAGISLFVALKVYGVFKGG